MLQTGLKLERTMTVGDRDTASYYGSGGVDVFATPAMIAFMECTAMHSVQGELNEGDTTVGTVVNIRHLSATPVGREVRCMAELTGIDRKRLSFSVAVYEGEKLVGDGEHERFIINIDSFMRKVGGGNE